MKEQIIEILNRTGAILNGHFVYTSFDKHGELYVNKDAVYPHIAEIKILAHKLADMFMGDGVEAVTGPAVGGVVLSHCVAEGMNYRTAVTQGRNEADKNPVISVYADKTADGNFVIKRGYDKMIAGKKVLIVEDIVNTGGSVKKVTDAVRNVGGRVIGVGALCNRGEQTAMSLNVPKLISLYDIKMDTYDEHDCPLCKAGVPINTNVGKGAEFLAKKRNNPELPYFVGGTCPGIP